MNDFLSKVLPWVGAAATGGIPALIGMAAKTVGEVLGKDIGSTVEDITTAIAGATPDQLLKLKEADNAFALQMNAMGFKNTVDLEELAAGDRSNAREREKVVRDRTPMILAAFISLGFFGILSYMVAYGVNSSGGDAMLVMLGALGAAFGGVVSYYFGSSSGSAQKTDILSRLSK